MGMDNKAIKLQLFLLDSFNNIFYGDIPLNSNMMVGFKLSLKSILTKKVRSRSI